MNFVVIIQTLAVFGSILANFSISVSLYQDSQSLVLFSALLALSYLPELLMLPFAGVLTDFLPKRLVITLTTAGQAILFSLVTVFLLNGGLVQSPTYYILLIVVVVLSSIMNGIHRVAYNALLGCMFGCELSRSKYTSFSYFSVSVAQIGAPLCAGLMLYYSNLASISLVCTMLFAGAALLNAFNVPATPLNHSDKFQFKLREFWQHYINAVNSVKRDRFLSSFLVLHGATSFCRGCAIALFTPYVLSFADTEALGWLRSAAGAGMILGAFFMLGRPAPSDKYTPILTMLLISGVALCVVGGSSHILTIGIAIFIFYVLTPILGTYAFLIWQTKTPPELHGRVLSYRDAVAGYAQLAGYLVAPFIGYTVSNALLPLQTALSSAYYLLGVLLVCIALFAKSTGSSSLR